MSTLTNIAAACLFSASALAQTTAVDGKFTHIALPYALNALEPVISQTTMELHHGKHLVAYINNLNNALPGSGFEGMTLEEIVMKSEGAIFNNAGQTLNHNLYFTQFAAPQADRKPVGQLAKAIEATFGSFEAFQKEFQQKGATVFGSGWVWLAADKEGKLYITQEANAGNPVTRGLKPIFGLDVWEHAYYVDYQNRRPDHLAAIWPIVDWNVLEARYTAQ
ncbi:MAG: superoxide dismutase [Bacteroidales bacterium]|nr:superoxide dismutase [Bacteroidales bacterium]